MFLRKTCWFLLLSSSSILASASTPTVTVTSPGSGSSPGSPVNYIASASTTCAGGITSMRIYTGPGVIGYTIHANKLNSNLNLKKGSYSTVVQAWDKCGGVGKKTVNITVSKINLSPPKFLYATEYTAGKIAGYKVNPLTGSLTPTTQGAAWAHWGPVDIASDYWGNHLYAANLGSHDVSAYIINRTSGNLSQVSGSPFSLAGTAARVAVHPSGKFVYVTSTDAKGGNVGINAFAVQSNGSLKPVPGTPFGAGEFSDDQFRDAVTATTKYLYVSGKLKGSGAIGAFIIDQTSGALTPLPGSPFLVPPIPGFNFNYPPTDLAADPKGQYLYATLDGSDAVAGYAIDPNTGALNALPGSPYYEGTYNPNLPNSPWRLSIAPGLKFVYVADLEGENYTAFKLNASTGVLTYVQSINALFLKGSCDPDTVNVDPSGTFLYGLGRTKFVCQGSNAILGYSINQGNGNLILVPGAQFANTDVFTNYAQEKVLVTR